MSNIPDKFKHLADLTMPEIEKRIAALRPQDVDPATLSDDAIDEALTLMVLARRRASGPPKAATQSSAKRPVSLNDLLA